MERNRKNIIKQIFSNNNDVIKIFQKIKTNVVEINRSVIYLILTENVVIHSSVYNEEGIILGYISSIRNKDIEVFLIVDASIIKFNQEVYIDTKAISVKYYHNICGSVLSIFGDLQYSLIERDDYEIESLLPIFDQAPGIDKRGILNDQLLTGFNVIDMMYPIGYGQRMLIVGDSKTYKTTIALNIIKNANLNSNIINRNSNLIFIYLSVGQKKTDLIRCIDYVIENDIAKNVIFMHATSASPLGYQFIAPYAAMSIANKLAIEGKNVCLIIDDISKHAIAHKELCLLAGRVPGRESFQGDIFYMHSSLLERSLKYDNGGSITCLPIVETIEEEISSYIPTNVISITDGQIFCSKKMMNNNFIPPISTGLSVSRTGSSVQLKIMKKALGKCKKIITIYNNLIDFYKMYAEDCDEDIKEKIREGTIINIIIYKINSCSIDFIKQIISIVLVENISLFNIYNIKQIESKNFIKFIKNIYEKSENKILDNHLIMKKINKNINDESILSDILPILLDLFNSENNELE